MRRIWILVLLSLVGAVAWMAGGCSKTSTGNSTLAPLDTTTTAFLANNVSQPIIDQTGQDAVGTIELVGMIPVAGAPHPAGVPASLGPGHMTWDTVAHSYAGGWHVFYFALHRTDTTYRDTHMVMVNQQVTGYDSVRIWSQGQPVQFRGAADSLESRIHAQGTAVNSENDSASGVRHRVMRVSGDPWVNPITTLTFNGSSNDTLGGTFHPRALAVCTFNNTYAGSVNNVIIDSATLYADGCPPSGSMSFTAHVSAGCTGLTDTVSFNGTWTISVTYNHGIETKSFSNGLAQAVRVDTCGVRPVASPFSLH